MRINVEVIKMGPGRIGFKGVALERGKQLKWPPEAPGNLKDWSGIYVGSLEQARGNIVLEQR